MTDREREQLEVLAVRARLAGWGPIVISRWVKVCRDAPRRMKNWEDYIDDDVVPPEI